MRFVAVLGCLVSGVAWAEGPPRLAGTVVAPGHRAALFDGGSGIAVPVEEGESVEGYVVEAISPGGVRLSRDGQVVLVAPGAAGAQAAAAADTGGVTFGLALRPQPPVDD